MVLNHIWGNASNNVPLPKCPSYGWEFHAKKTLSKVGVKAEIISYEWGEYQTVLRKAKHDRYC